MIFQRFYYSTIIISLVVLDYAIGNGFVDGFQRLFGAISGGFRNTKIEDRLPTVPEPPISLQVFLVEVTALIVTMIFLTKYKQREKDPMDDLLRESRDTLKQTNENLDKWQHSRIPHKYSYLYDETHKKPMQFEVPVLHMAILDRRTPLNSPERGDASNTVKITDSELLSVTSLIDDDLESIPEAASITEADRLLNETQRIEYRNRFYNADKDKIVN